MNHLKKDQKYKKIGNETNQITVKEHIYFKFYLNKQMHLKIKRTTKKLKLEEKNSRVHF